MFVRINVSGDINAWGKQPDGKPWTVGIVKGEAAHEKWHKDT
jgi:thiamine biosynthesis lipoprotein ApbE